MGDYAASRPHQRPQLPFLTPHDGELAELLAAVEAGKKVVDPKRFVAAAHRDHTAWAAAGPGLHPPPDVGGKWYRNWKISVLKSLWRLVNPAKTAKSPTAEIAERNPRSRAAENAKRSTSHSKARRECKKQQVVCRGVFCEVVLGVRFDPNDPERSDPAKIVVAYIRRVCAAATTQLQCAVQGASSLHLPNLDVLRGVYAVFDDVLDGLVELGEEDLGTTLVTLEEIESPGMAAFCVLQMKSPIAISLVACHSWTKPLSFERSSAFSSSSSASAASQESTPPAPLCPPTPSPVCVRGRGRQRVKRPDSKAVYQRPKIETRQ